MSHTIGRVLGGLALASALALVSTACSSGGSTATDTSAQGGSSSEITINVGDQDQGLETLLTDSGVLNGASYKVNFVEFASGPLVDAGFAAQKIDLGSMGDLPASLSVKSGLPVVAAAVSLGTGAGEYLLAKPGITSIAQLRGKTVAYTTGTAEQAFALRALHQGGLTQQDVQQVNVTLQQLGTVLLSGAADASVVGIEDKIEYEQEHPGAVVLATDQTVSPPSYNYLLVTKAALADPAKAADIENLIERIIEAGNWERTHESQWITDYAVDVEHETEQVAEEGLESSGQSYYEPITSTVQSDLQQVVALMASAAKTNPDYSVASLFDATQTAAYNALLKKVPQNG